jgi:repressor of nif and glnA expression
MAIIAQLLAKYGSTLGAMAMAALLRYLEKTSLIRKYKKQINEFVDKTKNELNNDTKNADQ